MEPSPPILVITQAPNTVPVRVVLAGAITTLGSRRDADVQLPLLPATWAVVTRAGDAVVVRLLDGGGERHLVAGQHVTLGPVHLELLAGAAAKAPLAVGELAAALTGAQAADEALRVMVERVMAATGADIGAAIVREGAAYRVVTAVDACGQALPAPQRLLSDTVVREVLDGGAVRHGDVVSDPDLAAVPSVVTLQLQAVLCVPMTVGDRVVGALYFGKRTSRGAFPAALARELQVLASMAVPLLAELRRERAPEDVDSILLGEAPAVREVRRLIERVAATDLSVLVHGETGTGKEVAARALHAASGRRARPMVALNCSAVPAALLEAELFGYCRGAFSGAVSDRAGKLEAADGSTLLLDEIGDMPLAMQAALLRVLQEREVCRLGENRPRPVDVRVLAATHRDLDAEVVAGRFRGDLLFRLRELTVALPPLRERGDDVLLLARVFLRQAERSLSLPAHALSPSAERALCAHDFPGNVRELRSLMRRAAVLCDGAELTAADLALPGPIAAPASPAPGTAASAPPPPADEPSLGALDRPLADARDAFVSRYVTAVLERHGGDRQRAASALGISVRSLYRYL